MGIGGGAPSLLAALSQAPSGPAIDPRLARYKPLIDSLASVAGTPKSVGIGGAMYPDLAGQRNEGLYDPRTKVLTLSPETEDVHHMLEHEFGHVLQFADQSTFFSWMAEHGWDRKPDHRDLERFADDFVDAFDYLAKGDTTAKKRKGMDFLVEVLSTRGTFFKEGK